MRISDWSSDVCSSDLGYNWFKDPDRPWANVRVDLCPQSAPCSGVGDSVSLLRLGDKTRAADANLIPILDRALPADIWARRKGIVDRKSVVEGKSVSVGVDIGGRRIMKKKNNKLTTTNIRV